MTNLPPVQELSEERLSEILSAANYLTAHSSHPRITVAAVNRSASPASPSPATGVRVKDLEWESIDTTSMWASVKPLWWCYRVVLRADRLKQLRLEMLGNRNEDLGLFAEWDPAQEAAQEHFAAALSALVEQP